MKRVVILGAGTAGTIMANRLAKMYRRELADGSMQVTVVDQDDRHLYQPGLLFLPFGEYTPSQIVKPRRAQVSDRVAYMQAGIDRVEPDRDVVFLEDGRPLPYDVLIVATGTRVAPEETEGLLGDGWRTKVFDFYTLEGATALRHALAKFQGGRLVIDIVDMPIKCPVAPLEFAFLADAYFTRRGIRDKVDITYVTPLDSAFTKATCAKLLTHFLSDKRISLVTEFSTGTVLGNAGRLISYDERTVDFDLLVTVPLHVGQDYVGRSPGLGDSLKFVPTDPHTLQAKRRPNIFALGDATDLPASKAGSVVHFQAEILAPNIRRFLEGRPLDPGFDGHSNCFIETGFHKALLIDFNYAVEPVPGRFPFVFGPMPLLKESRLNHLGKLAFRWIYWNMLLPGRDLPGISPRMSLAGKRYTAAAPAPVAPPEAQLVTAPTDKES
ncbi:MAG TPA: FAD/NAD(P)-binding oxidoreductase [Gemmatimonadales bacterium]|nr:FAD/NAD(P)-binding oxidoreductase [Gemmatimonadales bacterium]